MLRVWKPAVVEAGLAGVTAHDLPHSAATYLDAVGAPEQLLRRRLGQPPAPVRKRELCDIECGADET
jgi:integrase